MYFHGQEARYTAHGEAAKNREARTATEVRYFLTFISVPLVVCVSIGELWPHVWAAPPAPVGAGTTAKFSFFPAPRPTPPPPSYKYFFWRMMAGRMVILLSVCHYIRSIKKDPSLYAVNIAGIIGIPAITFYCLYLKTNPSPSMRITLLRAVVAFYIHSRPVKILL